MCYELCRSSDIDLSKLPDRSKGRIYSSIVLGILLYGCESWLLSTPLMKKLKAFHHRCVRALCGVSRNDVRNDAHGHLSLFARLNVPCVERLISNRKLRWAGHVARMDIRSRLPRKFLSSWVRGVERPRGRVFSYGHDLARELRALGFNLDGRAEQIGVSRSWVSVAQDRYAWRELVEPFRQVSDPMSVNPVSSQGSLAANLTMQTCNRHRVDIVNVGDDSRDDSVQPPSATWAVRLRPRG